ncbi:hypothetical protein BDAP_000881 [Binucleata daphniae]
MTKKDANDKNTKKVNKQNKTSLDNSEYTASFENDGNIYDSRSATVFTSSSTAKDTNTCSDNNVSTNELQCTHTSKDKNDNDAIDNDSASNSSTEYDSTSDTKDKILDEKEIQKYTNVPKELLACKKDLLEVYLINLSLYKEEKNEAIKEMLIKIVILLEKLNGFEKKAHASDIRKVSKEILENKGIRKKGSSNPRTKHRKKNEEMKKVKRKIDNNIDVKKIRSDKFR